MLPPLVLQTRTSSYSSDYLPDDQACFALWDKYVMLPNIREHSLAVASICDQLAAQAIAAGYELDAAELRAAALLHDLAKTYTLHYHGLHEYLGAAIVREETGNCRLAQAVLFHVNWPWNSGPLAPAAHPFQLPLLVSYADKRVRHNQLVTLQERFEDLLRRYGNTAAKCARIKEIHRQTADLEAELINRLGSLCLNKLEP